MPRFGFSFVNAPSRLPEAFDVFKGRQPHVFSILLSACG